MAWAPDYCTAAQLKSWLRIGDTADDALLAFAVTAASRDVDQYCGRQFGVVGSAEARYYTWSGDLIDGRAALAVDDLQTVTDLEVQPLDTDGAALGALLVSGADFDLWPWNAAAKGHPWTHLVARSTGTWSCYPRSVAIEAKWGWTAVPSSVLHATLLEAAETFARRNAPFGIAGSPEMGSELRLLAKVDPDAARLLAPFKRHWGAA